jgi:hypothetical protein
MAFAAVVQPTLDKAGIPRYNSDHHERTILHTSQPL